MVQAVAISLLALSHTAWSGEHTSLLDPAIASATQQIDAGQHTQQGIRTNTPQKSRVCTYCSKTFAYNNQLITHVRIHTGEKPYKCSHFGCNKAFTQKGNLATHMERHCQKLVHQDTDQVCKNHFSATSSNAPGASKRQKTSPFATPVAQAFSPDDITYSLFPLDLSLQDHLPTLPPAHAQDTQVKDKTILTCPYCGKTFTYSSQLTTHIRTHTGEKPFECSHPGCNTAFADRSYLTKHLRTHTGEKPYTCSHVGCTMAFTQKSNLTRHLKTHTGEKKPYQCSHVGCNMTFARKGNLTTHMKTHRQELVHQDTDQVCKNHFSATSSNAPGASKQQKTDVFATPLAQAFNPDAITHSLFSPDLSLRDSLPILPPAHAQDTQVKVKKSLTCPYCGKTFTYNSWLIRHIRIHTGEKLFKCSHHGCNWAFAEKADLTKHLKTHSKKSSHKDTDQVWNFLDTSSDASSSSKQQKTDVVATPLAPGFISRTETHPDIPPALPWADHQASLPLPPLPIMIQALSTPSTPLNTGHEEDLRYTPYTQE